MNKLRAQQKDEANQSQSQRLYSAARGNQHESKLGKSTGNNFMNNSTFGDNISTSNYPHFSTTMQTEGQDFLDTESVIDNEDDV